jgi:hypothetical protein
MKITVMQEQSASFLRRCADGIGARTRGREAWMLALLVMGVSSICAEVLYRADRNSFLYFGDAISHLTHARLFVDSRVPGIHSIGTVWLPLPHMIYLPAALIDRLYYSGIAGPVTGIPFLTATTLLLYALIRRLIGSAPIAFLCALLFGINPNLVYLALTPMTEILLLFFLTLAGVTLLKWIDTDREFDLLVCAASVVCASLCRYEAWMCVPFVSVLALIRARALSAMALKTRALVAAFAAAIVWAGIVVWLLWNLAEYGDALKFVHWPQSIALRTASELRETDPLESLWLIGAAIRAVFGSILLIAAAGAIVRHLRAGLSRRTLLVFVFLSLPGVFMLAAVISGNAQIDQWRWNWRYMLTFSLFFPALAAVGLQELFAFVRPRAARAAIVLGALAIPVIQTAMPGVGVSTYIDAKKGFFGETQNAKKAGELLGKSAVSGSIALLTGYRQSQRIMISSGLPLRTFHLIYHADDQDLFKPLWPDEQYVVIGKQPRPESRPLVDYWLEHRSQLLRHYSIVGEDDLYLILRLNPARN